nr:hypothetical protein [Tanacetum cinerariifolium]
MMQSEVLIQTPWPIQSYFHSNLDYYESEHHEFLSSINSTPENSLVSSEAYLPVLTDECVDFDSQNIMVLDEVCQWLCDDDQGIEEIQSETSVKGEDVWSPCLSMEELNDVVMEPESQTGLHNLLKAYGEAIAMGHKELADVIVRCISEKTTPVGTAVERIAFNLFQGEDNQGNEYLKQEAARNFMQAFSAFYRIFPYGKFAHYTSNSAILEVIPIHAKSVHIFDFDICEGSQWAVVIEAIAQQRKSLTITSVKLEEYDSGFEETKRNLFNYARTFGLNLKVQEKDVTQMVQEMEGQRREGREFLVFNCMVGLPHMGKTRKTTEVTNFLSIAKAALATNDGIITFGDGEGHERMDKASDFSSFFDGKLAHYKALYESMEWGFPSHLTEARMAMETLFVTPFISSNSWLQKWMEGRENMVSKNIIGLKGRPMSTESLNEARELVKQAESPYGIRVEGDSGNEMVLEWNSTPLVKVSVWV